MSVHNATRARWRRGRSIGPVLVVSGSIADAARTMDSASGELRRTDGRTDRATIPAAGERRQCVRASGNRMSPRHEQPPRFKHNRLRPSKSRADRLLDVVRPVAGRRTRSVTVPRTFAAVPDPVRRFDFRALLRHERIRSRR